jgi:aspartate/methionine/tyrosine aminotransferase
MHRASECGYGRDGETWTNLGQGSPEVGVLEGAPERREKFQLETREHSYGPVGGLDDLRDAVASFYNELYRQKHTSKYTAENVSIAGGGRAAMTRLVASMAEINLGHFIPDYTAYEELLGTFKGFVPIPILLEARQNYRITAEQLEEEIVGRGLSALLFSNPSNPTGQVVAGEDLASWVEVSRRCRSTFILDEFYSHYVYDDPHDRGWSMVSAAEFVDDVDQDPIILVDGLTKNWRYPGWRVSWIVGPKAAIEQVNSAGSFLDGGASHPFQRRAVELLDPELAVQETRAIAREFRVKRAYMSERLQAMGVRIDAEPQGAFYIWADLSELPLPLNDGMRFFEEALKYRVITVPGGFFDVNPGQRRAGTRFKTYSRFSFGPSMTSLELGLDALERMIRSFS